MIANSKSIGFKAKLYESSDAFQWEDRGTGCVKTVFTPKGTFLVMHDVNDGSLLLESKIKKHFDYDLQQETIIVWTRNRNRETHTSLSFLKKSDCEKVWKAICRVLGRNPAENNKALSVGLDLGKITDFDSEDEFLNESLLKELPPTEESLERVRNLFLFFASLRKSNENKPGSVLRSILKSEHYIPELLKLVYILQDKNNIEGLKQLFNICMDILLINPPKLLEIIFGEAVIFDFVECLDDDPLKNHSEYLKNHLNFRQPITINNPALLAKIHQTYRVQYTQDMLLTRPALFDCPKLSSIRQTFTSFITRKKCEIVALIQSDDNFLDELFAQLRCESSSLMKRRDLALLLKELCEYGQLLEIEDKTAFYRNLFSLGILAALGTLLKSSDWQTKSCSIEMFASIAECCPSLIRLSTLPKFQSLLKKPECLFNTVIHTMVNDAKSDYRSAEQLMVATKNLFNPKSLVDAAETTEFLIFFSKSSTSVLMAPILENIREGELVSDDFHTVQQLGLVLEMLLFCFEQTDCSLFHHIRDFIVSNDLLKPILVLLRSSHMFLVLTVLRFLRKFIGVLHVQCDRYIVEEDLLAPVLEAFNRNKGRFNMLHSAILELLDFIQTSSQSSLQIYAKQTFGSIFSELRAKKNQFTVNSAKIETSSSTTLRRMSTRIIPQSEHVGELSNFDFGLNGISTMIEEASSEETPCQQESPPVAVVTTISEISKENDPEELSSEAPTLAPIKEQQEDKINLSLEELVLNPFECFCECRNAVKKDNEDLVEDHQKVHINPDINKCEFCGERLVMEKR